MANDFTMSKLFSRVQNNKDSKNKTKEEGHKETPKLNNLFSKMQTNREKSNTKKEESKEPPKINNIFSKIQTSKSTSKTKEEGHKETPKLNNLFSKMQTNKQTSETKKEKKVKEKPVMSLFPRTVTKQKDQTSSKPKTAPSMNIFNKINTKKESSTEKNKEEEDIKSKKEKKQITEDLLAVNEKYTLITQKKGGELVPLVYSHIKYSSEEGSLVYSLVEPKLSDKLKKVVDKTIDFFEERVDIPLDKLKARDKVYPYLLDKMKEAWKVYDYSLDEQEVLVARYYIFRETLGLGKIEALMHDPNIEDVSCDGANLPVYIYHRNPRFGEMPTTIIFEDKEALDNYVLKLAQKCGRSVSVANPLMDGSLPDGSRVQVTYGTEIARRGSNFTIRKFTKKPLSPIDLINFGTVNAEILAYLWLLIEKQKSILITGSTAVGKTSFLNALSLFIDPNAKVVSIEDTSELRLPHPNWIPEVSRIGFGPHHYGQVDMYDLLKASLRQRPDYLVVGEVRGKEASVMFHAISTGHAAFSTIHADRMETVIDRLTTRPISLPPSLLETLNIVVFLVKSKRHGKLVRRLGQIQEIYGYDTRNRKLLYNEYAHWNAKEDVIETKNSKLVERIPSETGLDLDKIKEELDRRKRVLQWMKESKIEDYRDVAKIIQLYYTDPEQVFELVNKGAR